MEAKYFKSMASDGVNVVSVYKNIGRNTAAIYYDGSVSLGLIINYLTNEEYYLPATEKEFNKFRKMAIKKLQSL